MYRAFIYKASYRASIHRALCKASYRAFVYRTSYRASVRKASCKTSYRALYRALYKALCRTSCRMLYRTSYRALCRMSCRTLYTELRIKLHIEPPYKVLHEVLHKVLHETLHKVLHKALRIEALHQVPTIFLIASTHASTKYTPYIATLFFTYPFFLTSSLPRKALEQQPVEDCRQN
jgi:hypothetical protein